MSSQNSISNEFRLIARIVEVSALRYTPAGAPVANCVLAHHSRQVEAGIERDVRLELPAMAIGELAKVLASAPLEADVRVAGFLAAKSARTQAPVLHLNELELIQRN